MRLISQATEQDIKSERVHLERQMKKSQNGKKQFAPFFKKTMGDWI